MKKFLSYLFLFIPFWINAQEKSGTIYSRETNTEIAYVNIGIIGRNIGTVSDVSGKFKIELDSLYYKDSIRFSYVGYKPLTLLVKDFVENDYSEIYLNLNHYNIEEAIVVGHRKSKPIVLGIVSSPKKNGVGFAYSSLGSEMGINVYLRNNVLIQDINFKILKCPFDTVEYRLNIYKVNKGFITHNILKESIYLKFTKDEISEILSFDLRKYNIILKGNILITLELFKDLGEGKIIFESNFDISNTWCRKTSEGRWYPLPGVPVLYLNGLIIKLR